MPTKDLSLDEKSSDHIESHASRSSESTGDDGSFQHPESKPKSHKKHNSVKESSNSDAVRLEFAETKIKTLEKKLFELQKESDNNRDNALRALADLDNYKKRIQKERSEVRINTIAELMETLLPVLDNFEFGLSAAEQHGSANILDGFKMIFSNLKTLLSSFGLQEINPINEVFDMHIHDCVKRVVDKSKQNDIIVAVDRKGYLLNGKLLRAAMVAVAQNDE